MNVISIVFLGSHCLYIANVCYIHVNSYIIIHISIWIICEKCTFIRGCSEKRRWEEKSGEERRNTAHQPSLQASHTIYSGTTMQEYQPAAQIKARHNMSPQMAPYMSWIFLVLVGIDPGVYHLWSEIVSHNTTGARQSHSTPPSTIFTGIPHSYVHGPLIFSLYAGVWKVWIFCGSFFNANFHLEPCGLTDL